jgi:four helix bundle protein
VQIADCGLKARGIAMDDAELKQRTRAFAVRVIRFAEALPESRTANVIGGQLIRCGTSVGSNYRAACRAKSRADFIAKMGIVEEECDETIYWMELVIELEMMDESRVAALKTEANEILSIAVASIRTARAHNPQSAIRNPKSKVRS